MNSRRFEIDVFIVERYCVSYSQSFGLSLFPRPGRIGCLRPYAKRGKSNLRFYDNSIANHSSSSRASKATFLTGPFRMNDTKDSTKYISATYFALRIGLAAMAFAFPILLLIGD